MSKDSKPTQPSKGNGSAPACDPKKSCCPADFDLSPCRIVKVKGSLQIAATEKPGYSGGTYEWTTSSDKITLENAHSSSVTVKAKDNPGSGRDSETITVKRTAAGCPDVTKQVKVTVAKITFSKSANQLYGYDDFDTPADNTDDHICVKKSDHTFLKVKIEGGAIGTDFEWKCDTESTCTAVPPGGDSEFDLRLDAGAENKKETTLKAISKCPSHEVFASIKVHVYKEREVDVVIAKIDKTDAGTNLRFPTADYASHQNAANDKLKEAVVKYNLTNYDANNKPTAVTLASGTATVTFDIAAGGGSDLTAIGAAMTGTGSKVRTEERDEHTLPREAGVVEAGRVDLRELRGRDAGVAAGVGAPVTLHAAGQDHRRTHGIGRRRRRKGNGRDREHGIERGGRGGLRGRGAYGGTVEPAGDRERCEPQPAQILEVPRVDRDVALVHERPDSGAHAPGTRAA